MTETPTTALAPTPATPAPGDLNIGGRIIAETWAQIRGDIGAEEADKLQAALDPDTWRLVVLWLAGRGRRGAASTKQGYANDLRRWADWLTEVTGTRPAPVMSITRDVVTMWVNHARAQGLAVRTRNRRLSVLSSLFLYAQDRGWDVRNPVSSDDHRDEPGSEEGRPAGATRVLTLDEAAAMRGACETDRDRVAFSLLYDSGLRVSEVVSAYAEQLTGSATQPTGVQVRRKGRVWHQSPLAGFCAEALVRHLAGRTEGPLLTDAPGNAADRSDLVRITRRVARRAGLTDPAHVTPHVLRATVITALLNAGYPLAEVQRWAGHAYPQTTQGYWARSNAIARDAALTNAAQALLDEAAAGLR